jgi:hypothetical protein
MGSFPDYLYASVGKPGTELTSRRVDLLSGAMEISPADQVPHTDAG